MIKVSVAIINATAEMYDSYSSRMDRLEHNGNIACGIYYAYPDALSDLSWDPGVSFKPNPKLTCFYRDNLLPYKSTITSEIRTLILREASQIMDPLIPNAYRQSQHII